MTINGGTYFAAIMESLKQLGRYNVQTEVLDTRQHGVPHHRKRLYIVGIRKDVDDGSFAYPEPIPCPSIERFLEPRPVSAEVAKGIPPATQTTAVANVRTML